MPSPPRTINDLEPCYCCNYTFKSVILSVPKNVINTPITNLQMTWGQAPDRGEWDVLKNCIHPDGAIQTSWISGSGYEIIDKSATTIADSLAWMANP